MATKIFKYELGIRHTTLKLPVGARVLTMQCQFNALYLWAIVDPAAETEDRTFVVYGTGHVMDEEKLRYIGTAQMLGGDLIWHAFEVLPPTTAANVGARTAEALENLADRLERGERIPVTRVRSYATPDGPMHTFEKGHLGDEAPGTD